MRIRLAGAELFSADEQRDRQTDMTKLIAAFRNFANAPKKDETGSACGQHGKDFKIIYKICDIILN